MEQKGIRVKALRPFTLTRFRTLNRRFELTIDEVERLKSGEIVELPNDRRTATLLRRRLVYAVNSENKRVIPKGLHGPHRTLEIPEAVETTMSNETVENIMGEPDAEENVEAGPDTDSEENVAQEEDSSTEDIDGGEGTVFGESEEDTESGELTYSNDKVGKKSNKGKRGRR